MVSVWEERTGKKAERSKNSLYTEASFIYTLPVSWAAFNKCVVKNSGCFT